MVRNTTDELWKVLPFSSTDLERDLCAVTPFDGLLDPAIPLIKTSKLLDIPDNFLPWLIIEYGLGAFCEFQPNMRQLVTDGLVLRKQMGTPAGLKLVMGWLGFDTVTVFSEATPGIHGYEYQMDLGKVPDDLSVVCKIVKLARLVAPVRSRLRRLIHGWNIPMMVLDNDRGWDDLLDNYSGVKVPNLCDDDPKCWLSFADHIESAIAVPPAIGSVGYSNIEVSETEFGIYIDGPELVVNGELIVDPNHPSIDGDIIIDGVVTIE